MTWLGLIAVGLTAIVWSFTALSDLARLCGVVAVIELPAAPWVTDGDPIRLHVAWGLPITVDVLALVATRVWLRGQAPDDAVRYARRAAWGAILATIAGNAYHGWLTGQGRLDAIVVSAAPAVVIGVIVHLAVLAGRPGAAPSDEVGVNRVSEGAPPAADTDDPPIDDEPEPDAVPTVLALVPGQLTPVHDTGAPFAPGDELGDRRGAVDTANLRDVVRDLGAIARITGRRYSRDEVRAAYRIKTDRAAVAVKTCAWPGGGQQGADEDAEGSAALVPVGADRGR